MTLAIYGGGGLGREVLELAGQINEAKRKWENIVFIDDVITDDTINGIKRYSYESFKTVFSKDSIRFVIALGEPKLRNALYEKAIGDGYEAETLIHPNVRIPETAEIGKGVVICANSLVSANTQICDNVYLQPVCVIGHDARINASSVISAFCAISGHCVIGEGTYIGIHSGVKEQCAVGARTIIGMGTMVFKDIPDGVIVMGNPGRVLKNNVDEKVFR